MRSGSSIQLQAGRRVVAAGRRGAGRLLAGAVALSLVGASVALAVETYDSGWAVSGPAPKSVLESPRVPVDRLLPADALQQWKVRPQPQATGPQATGPQANVPQANGRRAPQAQALEAKPAGPSASNSAPGDLKWRSRSGQPAPAAKKSEGATPPKASAAPIVGPDRSAQQVRPREPMSDDIAGAFALPGAKVTPAPPEMRAGEPKTQPAPMASDSAATKAPPREPAPFPGLPEQPPKTETPRIAQANPQPKATGPKLVEPRVEPPVKNEPIAEKKPVVKPTPTGEEANEEAIEKQDDQPVAKPQATKPPADEAANQPAIEKESTEAATEPEKAEEEDEEELSTRTPAKAKPRLPAKRPAESAKPAEQPPAKRPAPGQAAPRDRTVPGVGIYGALRPASDDTPRPLSRSEQYLRRRLRSVLSYYYRRPLNNRDHDPWEVMHGMLAYGLHSRLLDTSDRGKPVTAIGYLCYNKPCKRKRLLHLTPDGQIDADVAYGLQGHRGQFLAMLAQCNVSPDYPVRIEDKEFTIHDLVDYEMRTCSTDIELTFKLIALAHYLDLDETWTSEDGERWSVSRLIAEERNQKIRGAPCGGTHRLSGIALAAQIREARGEPLDGEFLEARRFTEQQQAYAFRLQNRDGSLSTEWFRGPGAEEDINRRVRTTGHLLEWLLYSLPEDQLNDSRTVRAVNYLTSLLASNTGNAWEAGPLSHALHALMLYDERVFQPYDELEKAAAAKDKTNAKAPTLSYQTINSKVYGTYPSAEAAEEAREEAENPGGLRALFGIGRSNSRRSR